MNLQEYNNKLHLLTKELEQYGYLNADEEYVVLKKLFDIVYKSDTLNIITLPKEIQDEYKLLLFKTLTQISGTLAF